MPQIISILGCVHHKAWQDQLCGPSWQWDDQEDQEWGQDLGGGEQHQQEFDGSRWAHDTNIGWNLYLTLPPPLTGYCIAQLSSQKKADKGRSSARLSDCDHDLCRCPHPLQRQQAHQAAGRQPRRQRCYPHGQYRGRLEIMLLGWMFGLSSKPICWP